MDTQPSTVQPDGQAQAALSEAVQFLYGKQLPLEVSPTNPDFGDFTSNVAMQQAKELGKAPRDIATEVCEYVNSHSDVKAEVAGPGFINMTLPNQAWQSFVAGLDAKYANSSTDQPKRIVVEYISANPTGPMTLANGRGGYSGNVLAKLLKAAGHEVEEEYYINDAGNQIQTLNNSVARAVEEELGLRPRQLDDFYRGDYILDIAAELAKDLREGGEVDLDAASVDARVAEYNPSQHILEWIKSSAKGMGIEFDTWFSERALHDDGSVERALEALKEQKRTEEREGAIWLKTQRKDDRDRVLVRSDGTPTYLLADAAYHHNKLEARGFDLAINLWGADHAGQVASTEEVVEAVTSGGDLKVLIFQLVKLVQDGKEVKMSKRAGTYVSMDDLLSQVDPDVVRFFFLMRDFGSHMEFDLGLAKEESQKNPLYYVMYAYARAHSIVEEAAGRGLKAGSSTGELGEYELSIARQLAQLPTLVQAIAVNYEVHKISFWGIELARAFHDWYENVRVKDMGAAESAKKLFFLQQFISAMDQYWELLGVTPKQKM